MSGPRARWSDGQAVTTPDMQRAADFGAAADDLAYEALMAVTPIAEGGGRKRVLPLKAEIEGGPTGVLVAPSSTTGRVSLRPALVLVGAPGSPPAGSVDAFTFAGRVRSPLDSPTFDSNSSGSARTDLVYAVVQRATTLSASRKQKGLSGVISEQTFPLADDVVVTLAIAAGTTTAPSDSSTAFNVPLAEVTLANGYASGNAISSSQIKQVWVRAAAHPHAVRGAYGDEISSPVSGVLEVSDPTQSWRRFAGALTAVVPVKHKVDGAGFVIVGSQNLTILDWRSRLVRFTLVRPVSHAGNYPKPHAVTTGGASVTESSGWIYTGSTDGNLWTSARGFVVGLLSNVLTIAKTSGTAADDPGSGDHWLLVIEAMDQFV